MLRRKEVGETSEDINLACEILGKRFPNPVWLASGTLTEGIEQVDSFLNSEAGAIIPRTTRLKYAPGREKHPSPQLEINLQEGWMRNCEWTGATIDYWAPHLNSLAETGRVIMSVSGRNIEGCKKVCQEIDKFNFPLIEINISCAHSNEIYGFITRNEGHIRKVINSLKKSGVETPIALKLGHSDFIVPLAKAAEEAGADAIVAINTIGPVLDFNIASGEPELTLGISGGKGGLSGRVIFHIALTDVAELSRSLNIPVIGCGGISSSEDVIKMIMAGASAVQIYTAAHLRGNKAPQFFDEIVRDVEWWLRNHGYSNVSQIQGLVLSKLSSPHQMESLVPKLNSDLCIGCGKCIDICLNDGAISFTRLSRKEKKRIPKFNQDKCVGCGACISVCPENALVRD